MTGLNLLKHLAPRQLFWRSLLIMLIPMVLLQGVVAYIFFERHWDTVSRRLALGLTGDIIFVINTIQRYPDSDIQNWVLYTARREMQIDATFEQSKKLAVLTPRSFSSNTDKILYDALSERIVWPFDLDTQRHDKNISVTIQMPNGTLNILTPLKRMFSTTVYIFVLWMLGTAFVVTAIAIVFLRNQIRPIRRLAAAADAFGKGRIDINFKPGGATEIRQAASAFLEMRERIERHMGQQTEMLAGVSHDLRTPLTRIKLELTMLRETYKDADKEIKDIEIDILEMEKMIDEYLSFARGQGREEPVSTNIVSVLKKVAEDAKRKNAMVELEDNLDEIILPLRLNAINRCLTNLVDNAIHFGDKVKIYALLDLNFVQVFIEDNGPGIPVESMSDVFKPFFRLDNARNPNIGGAGLGLAIARDVARAHGGDIILRRSSMGGLCVILRLAV